MWTVHEAPDELRNGDEYHAANGQWLTAGEIIEFLARVPKDTPVTAHTGGLGEAISDWCNLVSLDVQGIAEGFPIVNLTVRDDFDTRQW